MSNISDPVSGRPSWEAYRNGTRDNYHYAGYDPGYGQPYQPIHPPHPSYSRYSYADAYPPQHQHQKTFNHQQSNQYETYPHHVGHHSFRRGSSFRSFSASPTLHRRSRSPSRGWLDPPSVVTHQHNQPQPRRETYRHSSQDGYITSGYRMNPKYDICTIL